MAIQFLNCFEQQPFKAKASTINKVVHFTLGFDIPGSSMEIESNQLDHDCNSTEESSVMQIIPPSSPEISGVCGHPIENPRVGDEYQTEIPSMISQSQHLQASKQFLLVRMEYLRLPIPF
ncbi:hypothetical protein NC652_030641 [Populus alba x Populus x berolinensis]|nr:hypothetical protein NC652_030641 [Populus alba x Populus x berolinensis]